VRELENIVERAVVMSSSERISNDALMIPSEPTATAAPASSPGPHSIPTRPKTAASSAPEAAVEASDSPAEMESATETATLARDEAAADSPVQTEGTLQEFLDRAAAVRIKKAIDSAKGNRNAAATALGIDRTTLYRLMRRLGL
jgi:DNA-binding NtrC family response regulator